uniref:Kazal-like domain-containing protein n=1 Tax=Lygus hesperus TaxID=30085 RepID=A0A146L0I0_LYGHE
MQSYALVIVSVVVLRDVTAQVEECPQYCSPVNNNYGPACASFGRSFKTFPNLCELFKERCANRRNGGPVIEFVKDGSCTTSVQNPRRIQPAVCPESCPANSNDSGAVCALVGSNFKTFPNYCEMQKEKCSNLRRRGEDVNFVKDGSCTTPVVEHGNDGQVLLRQVPEKMVALNLNKPAGL